MFSSNNNLNNQVDNDLVRKAKKVSDKITESIYVAANEPILACVQIQEHIHRTASTLLDKKSKMNQNESILKGILYDIEHTKDSLELLKRSKDNFDSIQLLTKNAIYFKQQTDYDENVRQRVQKLQQEQEHLLNDQLSNEYRTIHHRDQSQTNRFKRFSASFDLSNSIPIVASSFSADFKSLITQLTSKDSTLKSVNNPDDSSKSSEKPSAVPIATSKSLHTLVENVQPNDENNDDLKNSKLRDE